MKKQHVVILILWATVLILQTNDLAAHGGGTLQITNAPVGDCVISVWSAPPTAKVGTPLHITVGAAKAANGEPVLDATMQVQVMNESGTELQASAQATTDQSVNKLFYEADVPELAAGRYRVDMVSDCLGETGTVSFLLTVRPSTNPLFMIGLIGAGMLLLVMIVLLNWKNKKRDTAVEPTKKRRSVL